MFRNLAKFLIFFHKKCNKMVKFTISGPLLIWQLDVCHHVSVHYQKHLLCLSKVVKLLCNDCIVKGALQINLN